MDVGARIRDILTDRDIKYKVIAHDLGINGSSFSNYMTGATKMPYDVLVRVADYLGVSTDYLLGRTDVMESPLMLSARERAIILDFRALGREDKEFICQSIRLLAEKNRT